MAGKPQRQTAYQQLEAHFAGIGRLRALMEKLEWQALSGDAAAQGNIPVISGKIHASLSEPALTDLLPKARQSAFGLSSWQRANLRLMNQQHLRAAALTPDFVDRQQTASIHCLTAWLEAKPAADFSRVATPLQNTLELKREEGARVGEALRLAPYDALMDLYEPGLTMKVLDPLFNDVATRLPPLLNRILKKQKIEKVPLTPAVTCTQAQQTAIAQDIIDYIGLDRTRLQLSQTPHAVCFGNAEQIYMSYHFKADDPLGPALDLVHEAGHGLYRQHLPTHYAAQPVGQLSGWMMDEAQALGVENRVGRSRSFAEWLAPKLTGTYGADPAFTGENLYRLFNRVAPGVIRVQADEASYPLHILARYELEKGMVAGKLEAKDLPDAFNAQLREKLGVTPANDREGCLQDIHWYYGYVGYFPCYLAGLLTAAQLGRAAILQEPWQTGNEDPRHEFGWQHKRIHRHGSLLPSLQRVAATTGEPLRAQAYLKGLERKYIGP